MENTVRELLINRINELKTDSRFNSHRLFKAPSKKQTVDRILADGLYPQNFDFNTLTDEELVVTFERICRWAYKQM